MFHDRNITMKNADGTLTSPVDAARTGKRSQRRRGGRSKTALRGLVVLLVLAAIAAAAWWFYLRPRPVPAPQTVAASTGNIEQTVLASGVLEASSLVSVGAQVSGTIEKLDVKLGDVVKKGDLIAEINSLDQQNAVKSAQAALASTTAQLHADQAAVKTAQASLTRSDQLAAKSLVSVADHETAQAAVETAQAKVEVDQAQLQQANLTVDTAQLNLSRTRITAPSAGTVVAVLVDEGQTVNAVQSSPTIVKLADLKDMVVKAQISEADVPHVKPGQRVYFTILGEPDKPINAKLVSIDPAPDSIATESDTATPSTTTAIYYNGLFQVPNPDGQLRIDMTAQVTIVLDEAKDAVLVPSAAVHKSARGGTFVAVYDPATRKVHREQVSVGIDNNVMAQITKGLAAGDDVVATGVAGASQSPRSGQSRRPGGRFARSPLGF